MTAEEFASAMGAEHLGKFEDIVASLSPEKRRECAAHFEVAVSTVDRWANRTANPHPALRWQIVKWVLRSRAN